MSVWTADQGVLRDGQVDLRRSLRPVAVVTGPTMRRTGQRDGRNSCRMKGGNMTLKGLGGGYGEGMGQSESGPQVKGSKGYRHIHMFDSFSDTASVDLTRDAESPATLAQFR